ncbi:MAG: hypothetical protein Q7J98_14000 [Kiritimatiellia bacterium]|nr:hypothetical protein [Kiritimatiellia bacterium]
MTLTDLSLFQTYARTLCVHACHLIAEGYARMDKAVFASEQEPAITGELVREIRIYMESANDTPAWVDCYSIHDDPPLSVSGKLGKFRPRVDIEFECVAKGPRPRLRFEAKRLNSTTGHTVARYLGKEGLGCFLSGRYPMTHGEAGMLGYVQSDDEVTWAKRIETMLRREEGKHAVMDPPFTRKYLCPLLLHYYASQHRRLYGNAPVIIHHILLSFVANGKR